MIPVHMFDEAHGVILEDLNFGGFFFDDVVNDMYDKIKGRAPKYDDHTHFVGVYGLLNSWTTDLFNRRTRVKLVRKSCDIGEEE